MMLTKFERTTLIVCAAALIAAAAGFCFAWGFHVGRKHATPVIVEKHDTTFIRKPIHVSNPTPATVAPGVKLIFLPAVFPSDSAVTVAPGDTLSVPVREEIVTYENDDYRAVIGGIRPRIISLDVFPEMIYVTGSSTTTLQPPARRGPQLRFGLSAGPGLFWDGTPGIKPGIGAVCGLTLTF